MGVINATPDSYYKGSRVQSVDEALIMAKNMISEGVDILDIGGEATNPKLDVTETLVSVEEEMERVVPIIKAIRAQFDVTISVDTSKPEVMQAAITAGANIINDQRALLLPGALEMAAVLNVPVCLMHMYGLNKHKPRTTMLQTTLDEIKDFLHKRAQTCLDIGIFPENIIIDPGVGAGNFGKSTNESLFILKELKQLIELGFPVLVGYSNKSIIGDVLENKYITERLYGSISCAVMAAERGAAIIRVHNVGPTVDAIKMVIATQTLQ